MLLENRAGDLEKKQDKPNLQTELAGASATKGYKAIKLLKEFAVLQGEGLDPALATSKDITEPKLSMSLGETSFSEKELDKVLTASNEQVNIESNSNQRQSQQQAEQQTRQKPQAKNSPLDETSTLVKTSKGIIDYFA